MRVNLKFQRTAKVTEEGGVSVELKPGETIADVYARAYEGKFKEFLVSSRDYSNEKWEFTILKDKDGKAA